jgi:uncharacterized membrane protein
MRVNPPTTKRYWTRWMLIVLATAILVHVLSVWALPRVIMRRVFDGVPATSEPNRAYFPPMTTADSRRIVLPSPDLLYAICAYDLAQGPLRITANPALDGYWSIALYSAASDNWFVVNDRQAGGRPVDLVVAQRDVARAAHPATSTKVLESPSPKGLVLMRVLAADYAKNSAKYEDARRTFACIQ